MIWNNINTRGNEQKIMEEKERFYVNSGRCQMPYVNPFNDEVMKVYKRLKFIPCTNESDLVTLHYDEFMEKYVIHINEEVVHQMIKLNENAVACFYQKIVYGKNPDVYDSLGNKTRFNQDYIVPYDVEGMLVECRTEDETTVLQKDAFVLVQPRKKYNKIGSHRKPSIIMYGIDTVSRSNLRRSMPMIFEFLKSPGWYEMKGYNKVADNSFPNIFAMLTGFSPETAKAQICDTDLPKCLDNVPFIWKELKRAGYLTAYAEDESSANTFTYAKHGFFRKPVDYYFRPFLTALEKNTLTTRCPGCLMKYCLGRRLANSYIFDYCRQFMQRFVASRPIWGMFWSNHFSHDDTFMLSGMEHKILTDLLNFERDGAFEHTIMIFFSDHGARFGPLMQMKEAFLEERQPMMFIYLPPWFRSKYPQYALALAQNQNRLSSNFDMYNTLKHILLIAKMQKESKVSWAYDCPQCQSLFYPLPENRSCSEAAIKEEYCTCHRYEEVRDTASNWRMAELVVNRINQYLWQNHLQNQCANLTLRFVNATEERVDNLDGNLNTKTGLRHYHSKFQVHQNLGEFFATILYNKDNEELKVNVELISRINMYGNDSACVKNKIQKLYCICLTELRTK
ncbi:hypothetical protein KR074_006898 [Drosophila pseudoananassae]|nr:hypothetical protein KR074_006898 [Drosophila pseudoananassae]